ncbi:MAG TPA: glucose 1-dehydrogenase [Acidimicrobiales bacterium]|nr:glucose 1-dehydrogenase [Acidimicrobiales bacterium]
MSELQGKVALVTGASSGIGKATAMALAVAGADVVVADLDAVRGELVAADIQAKGGRSLFVRVDVADDESVAAMVDATLRRFARLDIAVNNAGIEGASAPTAECSLENWHTTLAINLTGVFHCMRHEIPALLETGGGSIVNMSSVAGLVGFATSPAYVASKHGVVGLTKAAALEYAGRIRVNAVCPGVIDTEMVARFTHDEPAAVAAMQAMEPVGRLGRPEEIADACVWLASDSSSFVTGQAIAVDGGLVTR